MSLIFRNLFLLSVLLLALAACTTQSVSSGYFGDFTGFLPSTRTEGLLIYTNQEISPGDYKAFIVGNISVYLHPNVREGLRDTLEVRNLVEEFRGEITRAIKNKYTVVDKSGPGVLSISAAIMDLKPVGARLSVHPATAAKGLKEAFMEAELTDSVTGERVGALVDTWKGRGYDTGSPGGAFRVWAELLVEGIVEMSGIRKGKPEAPS